jgi:hypothetical protein
VCCANLEFGLFLFGCVPPESNSDLLLSFTNI